MFFNGNDIAKSILMYYYCLDDHSLHVDKR